MPTINFAEKKIYKREYDNQRTNDNHKYVYNTSTWVNLRLEYLSRNPLCEHCKEKEIVKLASEVHHKIYISVGKTKEQKQAIGFNPNNLMSLCSECHIDIHRYKNN